MDRNTLIGWTLIFFIFLGWMYVNAPSQEEIEEQKRIQDSLNNLQQIAVDSLANEQAVIAPTIDKPDSSNTAVSATDSLQQLMNNQQYGPFAGAVAGVEQLEVIENDVMKITFSNRGGKIKAVELKQYQKVNEDENGERTKEPLVLLDEEKNQFEYLLPIGRNNDKTVSTEDLFFDAEKTANGIVFRANAGNGRYFEQRYELSDGTYAIDYQVRTEGLDDLFPNGQDYYELNWVNYLKRIEINTDYESTYSSLHFKFKGDGVSYCSYRADDDEDSGTTPVQWVSGVNQFFNTTLMADEGFQSGKLQSTVLDENADHMKRLAANLKIPHNSSSSDAFDMTFFVGPNEFDRLRAFDNQVYEIVPFGTSILGTINRWVIRPVFSFLLGFVSNKGIVILLLTFVVKLVLYPLTYRMLYSQSKMAALKPRLEQMKGKFKDDPQAQQMEQMKLYREFGVNPLGGCLPMVLQMPIWIALYRFFPASIEFRQASFLWADDLSTYDAFFNLPFEIPFGFGSHISLFTLLWAFTTLIYTYYNTRHMDMSANPAMKYMQYVMPLLFMGFFNSFASGLTCYLLFSNLFNITQTLVTKNVIIDQEKIQRELEAYKKKPKKKGGFSERLEKALKEQQQVQAERESKKKGGKVVAHKANVDLQAGFEKIIQRLDQQLADASPGSLSSKASKELVKGVNELEKLVSKESGDLKKMVNRTTAKKLRGLIINIEDRMANENDKKLLAKIDVEKLKSLKAKI